GKVRLSQRRFTNHGVTAPGEAWRVPVALKFGSGKEVHSSTVLLFAPTQEFALLPAAGGAALSWVFPHAQATGYYRWALPAKQLQEMAEAARQRLTPAERVAFIGNLSALLDEGALHGDQYLRLLSAMAQDEEPK